MEDLETRVQKLEKKYRALKYLVAGLICLSAYVGVTGIKARTAAFAAGQDESGIDKKEAGIPVVVEAEVFILKDDKGNIRGVWTADEETTFLSLKHKENYPIAAISVDRKNASMSLTDVYGGKISAGLTDSIRAITIMDSSQKNNIYMGLTASGEAAFDMVSTGNAAMVIDGSTSSLDMSGDTTIIALTETVGSVAALKAQPSSSALTFLDYQGKTTVNLTSLDGNSQLKLYSPATKEEKTIVTTPEEVLDFNENLEKTAENGEEKDSADAAKDEEKKEEKQEEKKDDKKIVNMKTYSPFSK